MQRHALQTARMGAHLQPRRFRVGIAAAVIMLVSAWADLRAQGVTVPASTSTSITAPTVNERPGRTPPLGWSSWCTGQSGVRSGSVVACTTLQCSHLSEKAGRASARRDRWFHFIFFYCHPRAQEDPAGSPAARGICTTSAPRSRSNRSQTPWSPTGCRSRVSTPTPAQFHESRH
jgi:hypothetical protein